VHADVSAQDRRLQAERTGEGTGVAQTVAQYGVDQAALVRAVERRAVRERRAVGVAAVVGAAERGGERAGDRGAD
jgi:hypothetical protein